MLKKPTAQTGTFGFCRHAKPTLKNQKSLLFPALGRNSNETNEIYIIKQEKKGELTILVD